MATRSTIALEFADGTVQQVYCHWDGYLAHNGKMLLEHYSNPFILRDLIDLGGLSSLRATIGTKHAFSQFDLPKEEVEAFINRTANMCTFYARDRGEKLVAHKFVDFQDYLAHHSYEEYEYILRKDGNWYVQCHDDPYVTLKSAIADEQDRIAQEETAE
mgnify:FL=1|jgi:hypothetical protein